MKQIFILTVTALKEKSFVNFMLIVLNIIDMFENLNEKLGYYFNQYRAAYDNLNHVYLKYDLKAYTKKVQDADNKRVEAFRMLRDKIRYNLTYYKSSERGEAAQVLMDIILLYGCSEISQMKIGDKTTALTNLYEDYEEKYSAEVQVLGLSDMVAELKKAQTDFMKVYLERNDIDAEIGLNAMAEARNRMTEAYRNLVMAVNLEAKRDAEGELSEFIDRINIEVRKNFIYTGQSTSNSAGSSSSGADSADVVAVKNATFEFVGGNMQRFRMEVGTPLEALPNTEGYKWKPEVPEVMPNRNIVFREVPIDDKKVKLTFHFIDHSEEIVEGIVGTALTAPDNTVGCNWDPKVPSVFPDEDKVYYEAFSIMDGPSEDDKRPILPDEVLPGDGE